MPHKISFRVHSADGAILKEYVDVACFAPLSRDTINVDKGGYIKYAPRINQRDGGQHQWEYERAKDWIEVLMQIPAFKKSLINPNEQVRRRFADVGEGFKVRVDIPADWMMVVLSLIRMVDEMMGWLDHSLLDAFPKAQKICPTPYHVVVVTCLYARRDGKICPFGSGHSVMRGMQTGALQKRGAELMNPNVDVTTVGSKAPYWESNSYSGVHSFWGAFKRELVDKYPTIPRTKVDRADLMNMIWEKQDD